MLLFSQLCRQKDFYPLIQAMKKENKPVLVTGVCSALRNLFPGAILHTSQEKALILLPLETDAARLAGALSSVLPGTLFFPSRDFSLVRVDSSSRDFSSQRLKVLTKVAQNDFTCVVSSVEAACQATMPPEVMLSLQKKIALGDSFPKETLLSLISQAGYENTDRVEGPGQFAARGDIIDLYLTGEDYPIRMELFGDEVDAIGIFDPITQRRIENIPSVTITPASEICFTKEQKETLSSYLKEEIEKSKKEEKEKRIFIRSLLERLENGMDFPQDLFLPLLYRFSTLFDYFKNEIIFLYEQSAARESLHRAEEILLQELKLLWEENKTLLPPSDITLLENFDGFAKKMQNRKVLLMENFFAGKSPIPPCGIFSFRTRTVSAGFRDMPSLVKELKEMQSEHFRPLILCENSMAASSLHSHFQENGLSSAILTGSEDDLPLGTIGILPRTEQGAELVESGFELSDSRFAVLTDASPVKVKKKTHRSPLKKNAQEKILSYTDLTVGDYVVHQSHGIGIFQGVEKMKSADGCMKDFIKISYAGSDILYVPCSNLDAVSKYIGPKSDSAALKLNKLGGTEWKKATSKAKTSAKNIAKQLVALYARRQQMQGFAFSPDTTWQGEFENSFPYGETDDQLNATKEIKADMEKPVPMDRLLCGDVGFGKTEVALRGVFKAVMDNKQAAILVPTTILAWQHYQTLLSRFKGYPVRIEMLSRFRTKKEQKAILEKLGAGEIDILVGTHRLLQPDVKFTDLGFLVIDEEQRFGVTHKERLKEISQGVDVLTLTATPIPRTLNMALGGIKDMSLLEEAPEDRFPVQTYVLEHDVGLIEEAIRRELRRNGQVFYLQNNIAELESLLPRLQRAFPEANIALAHGKMDKDSLSDIWKAMMDHEVDILLCTTIIETGVDLPDANTLIVENADHFGLSQLHQIRGRVGRSDRKAYAYLTYKKGKMLSEISVKRLDAIREYTRFGSGFQIALRDLEIRGAGNLLGAEQSGHLDSIGYDMYMKILNDAVLEEKGELVKTETECIVDLSLDGFIPEKYIPYPAQRMDIYRKIASLRTADDASDLTDELLDRYGDIPKTVKNLFDIALLRALAEEAGCEKITQQNQTLTFLFPNPKEEALILLGAVYASRLTLSLTGKKYIRLQMNPKESALLQCRTLLEHYSGFLSTLKTSTNSPERISSL